MYQWIPHAKINALSGLHLIFSPDMPLNTSDHQLVQIQWTIAAEEEKPANVAPRTHHSQHLRCLKIKWNLASKEEIDVRYTIPVEKQARQLFKSLNKSQLDSKMVDDLLHTVTTVMIQASLSLPHSFPSVKKRGIHEWNPDTKETYKTSLHAWKTWKRANKPCSGVLYHQYLQCKKDFK